LPCVSRQQRRANALTLLAYTIFIAQNLQAFILAVTDCRTFIETKWLIFAELVLFMPLAMIRNLAKLSGTALVADAFILIGSEFHTSSGLPPSSQSGESGANGRC
jgi:proton-coupled amino acid transporter